MKRLRPVLFSVLCGSVLCAGACATPTPSPSSYGLRQLHADKAVVLRAAENALLSAGYQIERRDESAGVVTSMPRYTEARNEQGLSQRRLVSPPQLRRLAEVRIDDAEGSVTAYCRIVLEEQVTEVYRLHAGELRTDDSPSATAIERDAATTRKQNTVWKMLRRDKAQEREILAAISVAVGDTAAAAPSQP